MVCAESFQSTLLLDDNHTYCDNLQTSAHQDEDDEVTVGQETTVGQLHEVQRPLETGDSLHGVVFRHGNRIDRIGSRVYVYSERTTIIHGIHSRQECFCDSILTVFVIQLRLECAETEK